MTTVPEDVAERAYAAARAAISRRGSQLGDAIIEAVQVAYVAGRVDERQRVHDDLMEYASRREALLARDPVESELAREGNEALLAAYRNAARVALAGHASAPTAAKRPGEAGSKNASKEDGIDV